MVLLGERKHLTNEECFLFLTFLQFPARLVGSRRQEYIINFLVFFFSFHFISFYLFSASRLVSTRRREYMRHYLQPPSQVSLLGLEKFSLEISIAEKKDVFLCRTNLD